MLSISECGNRYMYTSEVWVFYGMLGVLRPIQNMWLTKVCNKNISKKTCFIVTRYTRLSEVFAT